MEISCVYTDVINIWLIYNARFFSIALNKLVKLPSPEAMVEARCKSGAALARGQGGGCGGVGADPASIEIGEGGAGVDLAGTRLLGLGLGEELNVWGLTDLGEATEHEGGGGGGVGRE